MDNASRRQTGCPDTSGASRSIWPGCGLSGGRTCCIFDDGVRVQRENNLLRTFANLGRFVGIGAILKQISASAYQALRDALPAIIWNKRPFETFLRTALRGHPELLVGLNFGDTKRAVADEIVDRLLAQERKYRDVTLRLMLEISTMTRFPNVEQIRDPEDRAKRLKEAEESVSLLKYIVKDYSSDIDKAEQERAAIQARGAQAAALRRFSDDLESIKARFIDLQSATDVHARGYAFEVLLGDLFILFDLEPRLAYSLQDEQIDGSFTFDTDDYIVEARWRAKPADRGDGDIFASKVRRKGKNAVGLFVSVNGFTAALRRVYSESTPFITMDGADIFAVLEGRIRLDDLIRAKKRHANETGSCYLPASLIIG